MEKDLHSLVIYSFHFKFAHKVSVGLRHENFRRETSGSGY